MSNTTRMIGIDLGTTNSLAAVCTAAGPVAIPNSLGYRFTPSVVQIPTEGEVKIGNSAVAGKVMDPRMTVSSAKRFIGRKYNEVFDLAERMQYRVGISEGYQAVFELGVENYLPQVISALILKSLKHSAERFLNEPVGTAVVTVPAYFSLTQKLATVEAAWLAGLEVKRLIEEPTAAAIACRLPTDRDCTLAVLDIGGGTFDVSLLECCVVGQETQYEILSIAGDGYLGGDDFDDRLMNWLLDAVEDEHAVDLVRDPDTLGRFLAAAIEVKHILSDQSTATFRLQHLRTTRGDVVQHTGIVTRALFEQMCEDLFERLREPCLRAIADAHVRPDAIDQVILVGGASRMPRVQAMAQEIFGQVPRSSVNPFEAIALGAAIQASVLEGYRKDVLLLNITPMSLGVEDDDGIMRKMLRRNTTIPTKFSQAFNLASEEATSVEVRILEGESDVANNNVCISSLILEGLACEAKAGADAEVDVTFDIDANGTLHVKARQRGSGIEKHIAVSAYTGLPPADRAALKLVVDALWRRVSDVG